MMGDRVALRWSIVGSDDWISWVQDGVLKGKDMSIYHVKKGVND